MSTKANLIALGQSIDSLCEKLEDIRDGLQYKFDEASEGWQEGENGERTQVQIDELTSAVDCLQSARDAIESAVQA